MKISVIYFSKTGNTKAMGEEIQKGISEANTSIETGIFSIDEVDVEFVNSSSAVIVGTPSYYAAEAWPLKQWLDTCPCKLAGKLGAAFCTANVKQGGADLAIQNILTHMLVRGMLVYSGGTSHGQPFVHIGPMAVRDSFESDRELFRVFGQRIAQKAAELF